MRSTVVEEVMAEQGELIRWEGKDVYEEKKLRLFGFEVDPCLKPKCLKKIEEAEKKRFGSHNSESPLHEKTVRGKKYMCQFCFKEFANSQALGGHQNAHKSERQRKKKLQIRSRKFNLDPYLEPLIRSHGGFDQSRMFFDPRSSCSPSPITLSQASSGLFHDPFANQSYSDKFSGSKPSSFHIQPIGWRWGLAQSESDKLVYINSEPIKDPTQSITDLDLQLRLSMNCKK